MKIRKNKPAKKVISNEQLRYATSKATTLLLANTGWRNDQTLDFIEFKVQKALENVLEHYGFKYD